jgi:hypothetical protein
MLVQASLPRPIVRMDEFPKNVAVLSLRRAGVSNGGVRMSFLVDTDTGTEGDIGVEPLRLFQIEGEEGFQACEYLLPIDRLTEMHGNLSIVYGTVGVRVFVRSAYRASPTSYGEHKLGLSLIFPITGGGIVRMWDSNFDLANPGFDPKAPTPRIGSEDEELRLPGDRMSTANLTLAFNRTHKVEKQTDLTVLRRQIRMGAVPATQENLRRAGLDPTMADSYPLGLVPSSTPEISSAGIPRLPPKNET